MVKCEVVKPMKTFFSLLFEKVVDALNFELQMNEIMSNTPKKKKTTPRYDNSFKKSWTSSYPIIKASRKGVKHCLSDFSISHAGLGDVTRHISTDKPQMLSRVHHFPSIREQKFTPLPLLEQ